MTVVRGRLQRSEYSFTDLTDATVETRFGDDGRLEVTLTPDVSPDVATAIRCRIISRTPAQEALLLQIAALLNGQPSTSRTAQLIELLARYVVEL